MTDRKEVVFLNEGENVNNEVGNRYKVNARYIVDIDFIGIATDEDRIHELMAKPDFLKNNIHLVNLENIEPEIIYSNEE